MASRKKATRKGSRNGSSSESRGNARKRKKKPGRWVLLARLLVVALFLGSAGVFAATATLSYYARDLPTVEALKNYRPPQTTRITDRRGRLLSELFQERRTVVPMSRIPRVLVLSVLAAEDADFYRHQGLDYAGIVRALLRDILSRKAMQGASTVTQQIVKNILLTPERTVSRKIKELILARRLEQKLSKDEILFLYLNHICFGHGRYGVQEASRFYFGKDVEQLNLAEASMLAGIPKAPSRFSPLDHPRAARKRQRYVLDQLEAKQAVYWNDLPLADIRAARTAELRLASRKGPPDRAPEVVTEARRLLEDLLGKEAARQGGYTVTTSIDLDLQVAVRRALREGLGQIDKRHKLCGPLVAARGGRPAKTKRVKRLVVGRTYDAVVTGADDRQGTIELDVGGQRARASLKDLKRFNPDRLAASRFAEKGARVRASIQQAAGEGEPAEAQLELGPQGAVVVIDPRTREVLALVGGEQAVFGFDRATQAVRQPGSAFKPIVYALALRDGRFTPASLVLDAPEVFDEWKPDNYETWTYQGAVRLREALAQSINLVAVRLTREVGPAQVVDLAQQLGITTELEPSLAIGLGASGVRPIELVNAYAVFAAGGRWMPVSIVKKITDPGGKAVKLPPNEPPRQVLTPAAAYLVTSLLTSVVQEGTGKAARQLRRPAAGKTGTSNNARDAWFVGYTPEVVAGVWVGFDDHRPLGKGESGARAALPIWMEVIRAAVGDRPAVEFPVPGGITTARIDPKSGLLAYEGMQDALEEVFLEGTAPTQMASPPDVLDTGSFVMEQLGGLD
jgi:penicillin-binding protein 1A